MSLANSTIAKLRQHLLAKEISPRDIVTDVAQAIDSQNASIGAYLSWDLEKALKEADQARLSWVCKYPQSRTPQ